LFSPFSVFIAAVPDDLLGLQSHLFEVITQIIPLTTLKPSLRISFFAIVLKYCFYSFHPDEVTKHHHNMTFQNIHLLTQSLYNLHSGDETVNPAESLERLSLKNKLIKIGDDESNTNIVDIYIDYIPFLLKTLDFFAYEVLIE
jgi:hypothetical protein